MKPMTEQERQKLAEELRDFLNKNTFLRNTLQKQAYEIALASLTTKPEYFQWKWARDKNASWTTTPIEQLENAVAAFGGDGENVNYRMQYTAPPVPVIPDGYVLVPIKPTEDMIIAGFESEPDEDFSEPEVWKEYDAMSGCQQAAHKAKLCWEAMIHAALKANKF